MSVCVCFKAIISMLELFLALFRDAILLLRGSMIFLLVKVNLMEKHPKIDG